MIELLDLYDLFDEDHNTESRIQTQTNQQNDVSNHKLTVILENLDAEQKALLEELTKKLENDIMNVKARASELKQENPELK